MERRDDMSLVATEGMGGELSGSAEMINSRATSRDPTPAVVA